MVLHKPWQGTTHLPATGPVLRVAEAMTTENVSPHVQARGGIRTFMCLCGAFGGRPALEARLPGLLWDMEE